jgi:hypothetical protein
VIPAQVVAIEKAAIIKARHLRVDHADVRISIEHPALQLECVGIVQIIRVEERQVPSARSAHADVASMRDTAMAREDIPDPVLIAFKETSSLAVGAVVHDDNLNARTRLLQRAVNGSGEVLGTIVGGDYNANVDHRGASFSHKPMGSSEPSMGMRRPHRVAQRCLVDLSHLTEFWQLSCEVKSGRNFIRRETRVAEHPKVVRRDF